MTLLDPGVQYQEVKRYGSDTLAREAEGRWRRRGRRVKRIGSKVYIW